jgi:hypothetical protein
MDQRTLLADSLEGWVTAAGLGDFPPVMFGEAQAPRVYGRAGTSTRN